MSNKSSLFSYYDKGCVEETILIGGEKEEKRGEKRRKEEKKEKRGEKGENRRKEEKRKEKRRKVE